MPLLLMRHDADGALPGAYALLYSDSADIDYTPPKDAGAHVMLCVALARHDTAYTRMLRAPWMRARKE